MLTITADATSKKSKLTSVSSSKVCFETGKKFSKVHGCKFGITWSIPSSNSVLAMQLIQAEMTAHSVVFDRFCPHHILA